MKKTFPVILAYAIVFLFLIQAAGTLVESIYIMDLMNTNLDAKVLGVLFFFSPALLLPFSKKYPGLLLWLSFVLLLFSRGILPWLDTSNRVLASGFATGAALTLFFLLVSAKPRGETRASSGLWGSAGLALAVGLSVMLRTLDYGIDYSLSIPGAWTGLVFGLSLGWLLTTLEPAVQPPPEKKTGGTTPAIVGFFLIITLVWFAFSAPSVISRWTEGSYPLIVISISLLAVGWVVLSFLVPRFPEMISPRILVLWNLAFTICLTGTILAHSVVFPPTPDSASVVVGSPAWWQGIPLVLMLLLFPVVFLDLRLFLDQVHRLHPEPRNLLPGLLLGALALILLVFTNIFTNVWGYVEPVSLVFRGKFWLAYFLPAGIVTLLIWRLKTPPSTSEKEPIAGLHWAGTVLLALVFLGTLVRLIPAKHPLVDAAGKTSLKGHDLQYPGGQ